jgi:hypothetical protein
MIKHTATRSSHAGLGGVLKTHILKGKQTLCGLEPNFDSVRWTKNRYSFDPKMDCQKCAKKAGAR